MVHSLEDRILGQAFVKVETTLSSGISANGIFEMGRLITNPELFQEVIKRLGKLSLKFDPDLLTYVPNGAGLFAKEVAVQNRIPIAHTWKSPKTQSLPSRMYIRTPSDRKLIAGAKRAVLIEDVITTLLNTNLALDLEGVREATKGVVSILDRGNPEDLKTFPLARESIIQKYIPPMMAPDELKTYEKLSVEVFQGAKSENRSF